MAKKFAVIGLGVFGSYLAIKLAEHGAEVLAIDSNYDKLENIKDFVTLTVRLDSTDKTALKNQRLDEFDAVIIGIGDNFEASILTTAVLQQIGVKRIIVRGTTSIHKKIFNHLEIEEIILPAEEAAERLAESLAIEKVVGSFMVTSEHVIVEAKTPQSFVDKKLIDLKLTENHNVSLITIKKIESTTKLLGFGKKTIEKSIGIPKDDTVIEQDDILVLFGKQKDIESLLRTD
jgi:trk system potassium uptake protein TrkA